MNDETQVWAAAYAAALAAFWSHLVNQPGSAPKLALVEAEHLAIIAADNAVSYWREERG